MQLAFTKGEGASGRGFPSHSDCRGEDICPAQPQGEVHAARVLLSHMLSKFRVSFRKMEPTEQGLLGGGWAESHTVLKPSIIP